MYVVLSARDFFLSGPIDGGQIPASMVALGRQPPLEKTEPNLRHSVDNKIPAQSSRRSERD